ncbi:amino acid ABC transporter permease [Nesterenkonia lutea]|uniref:His/Glu/Gln/Arg/opine family amino acid ABC transporter permease subunit n=1 Tax=Nesterenkonia lutea TaxID=272919 RepID=A0ABR9JEM2_9MICC|nr:ABC transporter permease subunit [Nesterenkonia lutea]MBE1524376.1 His/Glu/Gln/Arg/opine family amino acid ABC transporter permease subunit [Nesterenkonia lutea]
MEEFLDIIVGLLPGLWLSVLMAGASVAIGIPLGFVAGLTLNGQDKSLRWFVIALVELFRGFPALLTLYLVYFGLTDIVTLDRFAAVVAAFGVTTAAYTAEIFRASIASVPSGQIEAAQAVALTKRQIISKVVVPHVLNIAVPPILGIVIITFQGTALAYAIGAKELLGSAYSIGMINFRVLEPLLVAALLYLLFTSLLAWMEILADRRVARITGAGIGSASTRRRTRRLRQRNSHAGSASLPVKIHQ